MGLLPLAAVGVGLVTVGASLGIGMIGGKVMEGMAI